MKIVADEESLSDHHRRLYWVSQKKLSFDNFQHYRDYLEWRFFCNENKRQRTISEQILKTFGQCQNCQNLTFK